MPVKDWGKVEDVLKKQGFSFRRASEVPELEVIPCGIPQIDHQVLGVGGFPRGTLCEINGPNASCKTTICLHLAASCQKLGGKVAFFNAEGAYNPDWGEAAGIKNADLFMPDFGTGEEAYRMVRLMIKQKVDLMIIDSLNALLPESLGDYVDEWFKDEKGAGEEKAGKKKKRVGPAKIQPGAAARMNSLWLGAIVSGSRKVPAINNTRCLVVFTNHLYTQFSAVPGRPARKVPAGGKGAAYNTHIRMSTYVAKWEADTATQQSRVKVIASTDRNRVAPPHMQGEFWLNLIRNEPEEDPKVLVDLATANGLVEVRGAWIIWKATSAKFQGMQAFKEAVMQDLEMRETILQFQDYGAKQS